MEITLTCKEALETVLDAVDYTVNNCGSLDMVSAVLSKVVIENARKSIEAEK